MGGDGDERHKQAVIRHSHGVDPDLLTDPDALAKAEAINTLRQFDTGMDILDRWLNDGKERFQLRIAHLLTLNRVALEGINRFAGTFRTGPIRISNSKHQPPPPTDVPWLIEDFCDYITANFHKKSALHLAAYALWRLNWIHPFADGNGRTARIVSYIIMSAKLGYKLPGDQTIPEQIAENKAPYYHSLEAADAAFALNQINVSAMENLLGEHLAKQLLHVHDSASHDETARNNIEGQPQPRAAPIESDVEYEYRDIKYRPSYVIDIQDALKTAREPSDRPWVENNSALFTGIMTVVAAILSAVLTWWLTK